GAGVTGLGIAAASVVGPGLKAGTATKEQRDALAALDPAQRAAYDSLTVLRSEFGAFGKALEPGVLDLFTEGPHPASALMKDLQPVAEATGKALGGLLDRVSSAFRSGEWQKFFTFMGKAAGEDVGQLTDILVSLLMLLPPLLTQLQPVA